MIDILSSIGEGLYTLLMLIFNTISTVLWAVLNIGTWISTLNALVAFCPSFILVFLEASLALMVVFAVLKIL